MSRGEAKRRFTLAEYRAATEGVECHKDKGVIDETLPPRLPGCVAAGRSGRHQFDGAGSDSGTTISLSSAGWGVKAE